MRRAWWLFGLYLAGCVGAPPVNYLPAEVGVLAEQATDAPIDDTTWWSRLDDAELSQMIEQGLQHSPSSRIALARLAQAEQDVRVATAARWPGLSATAARQARDFSDTTTDTRTDSAGVGFVWDADLWGKRRLQIEQTRQFYSQRWFEHQATRLALSTAIADTYFQIVAQRAQGDLIAAQVQVSRDLEALIEARFRLGQASADEYYQQREQTAQLLQLALNNETRRGVLEAGLDVLLGVPPDAQDRVRKAAVPSAPDLIISTRPQ
ncbi:MAG: TolC family protein, partial [Pseudomonadota bacterium]